MGNKPHKFQCCAHRETYYLKYQCHRYGGLLSPCCMHGINEFRNTCSEILLYTIVLYYNAVQLALLLANIIEFLLPNTIMIVVGMLCLFVYVLGKDSDLLNRYGKVYICVCLLSIAYIVAKVIVTIVPSFFCSFWTGFLGVFGLACVFPNIYKRTQVIQALQKQQERLIAQGYCQVCHNKSPHDDDGQCPHKGHCGRCIFSVVFDIATLFTLFR